MKTPKTRIATALALACLGLLTAGCAEEEPGTGTVTILLDHGGAIFGGLVPGNDAINIRDGWSVSVDKYIVTVGDIDVHFSTDESLEAEAGDVFVIDLAKLPAAGLQLWSFEQVREGRWEFNYSTPGAADGSSKHENVEQSDYDEMVANDWTYFIDGQLTKTDGQSCPPAALATPGNATPNGNMSGTDPCYDAPTIRFAIGATAETSYGPCEVDEVPGFAVPANGTMTVAATVHGDHIFFNGFPEGDEGGVMRLAQWLADSDLNLDGVVTQEELKQIAPSQLPVIDDRYQLGGSPVTPLENMHDFVIGQLKTQGHFQGEGECPVDGVEHHHHD